MATLRKPLVQIVGEYAELPIGDAPSIVIPACGVHNSAAISIATGTTATYLTFDTEDFDTDACHDLVTNTGRLTCKTAGLYIISANVQFAANATGIREMDFLLNGATTIRKFQVNTVAGAFGTQLTLTTLKPLAVNDYVQLGVIQDSGGALNVVASSFSPYFEWARLSN